MEKCNRVTAVYGNPTEYFLTLMGEVFNKAKSVAFREEDIMPIWDFDSGLYWTGYYTTDPYHKKNYRDAGKYLYAARKAFLTSYLLAPNSDEHKASYKLLEEFAETVSYLTHHDGISGTSKYSVRDKYGNLSDSQIAKIKKTIFNEMFENEFPINTDNPIFDCSLDRECTVPKNVSNNDIYLKVFKTGGTGEQTTEPIVVHLQENQNYEPDCEYEINCMCPAFPCACDLYLYPKLGTYSLIKLKKVENRKKDANILQIIADKDDHISHNQTHLTLSFNGNEYNIGYKKLNADATSRRFDHLSRYGTR